METTILHMEGLEEAAPALARRELKPGQWLAAPLLHPGTGVLLLPKGTHLTRDLIAKIRSMGLEAEAVYCLGKGLPPAELRPADLHEHYTRQRMSTERLAEAFGSLRDISFVLFCISAALAFAFASVPFAILGAVMLVAMLGNAWMSLHVLSRLSSLNRMFAGLRTRRA